MYISNHKASHPVVGRSGYTRHGGAGLYALPLSPPFDGVRYRSFSKWCRDLESEVMMGQLEKLAHDRDVRRAFVGSLWLKHNHKPSQSVAAISRKTCIISATGTNCTVTVQRYMDETTKQKELQPKAKKSVWVPSLSGQTESRFLQRNESLVLCTAPS